MRDASTSYYRCSHQKDVDSLYPRTENFRAANPQPPQLIPEWCVPVSKLVEYGSDELLSATDGCPDANSVASVFLVMLDDGAEDMASPTEAGSLRISVPNTVWNGP